MASASSPTVQGACKKKVGIEVCEEEEEQAELWDEAPEGPRSGLRAVH